MTKQNKISVIVLNYNGENLLKKFLPSITQLDYSNCEFILVDDGSTDGSIEYVRKIFPQFKIVKNEVNLGVAETMNVGAKYSSGEYLFWIANDMVPNPDVLQILVMVLQSDQSIGICGCKILQINEKYQNTNIIDDVGGELDVYGFPFPRGHDEVDDGQFNLITDVFFDYGCCFLMRQDVFKKIGGFDAKYRIIEDDIDLCWRTRLAGYRIVVDPDAVIYHKVSSTLSKLKRCNLVYFGTRNTLRTLIKNYSLSSIDKVFFYLLLLFMEMFFFLFIGRVDLISSDIKAVFWNIKNFSDTWRQHIKIQQIRTISDKDIQKMMSKNNFKFRVFKKWLRGEFKL